MVTEPAFGTFGSVGRCQVLLENEIFLRLVGLPEGMEESDMASFLRVNLSKWIPSLKGHNIEIDRAHRVYDGRKNSDRPCTLIFRVLR